MLTFLLNTTVAVNNDNMYKFLLSLIYDMEIKPILLYLAGLEKKLFQHLKYFVHKCSCFWVINKYCL